MYIVFVPFDWTRALSPICFWSIHNSMNFYEPELLLVYITPRYTILECNGHVVMVRISMKNDKVGKRFNGADALTNWINVRMWPPAQDIDLHGALWKNE